ncbi:MAG TPA: hypothetical protein VIJ39_09570 [Solirubrobacteraceae bacterium]
MRILVRGVVSTLCALAGCLVLGVSVAPAAVTHEYLSQITEVPAVGPHGEAVPLPGPLDEVDSLTADSGEIWLAEQAKGLFRVDQFDASSGAFVAQLPQVPGVKDMRQGVAVGHATGEAVTYVAGLEEESGVVLAFGASSLLGRWSGADTASKAFGCFECAGQGTVVAVDNSTSLGDWAQGDVYVADTANNVVDVFEPEAEGKEKLAAELTGVSPGEPFARPSNIAVSAFNGDVLVSDESGIDIFKPAALTGQYEFIGRVSSPPPTGSFGPVHDLTVDGSDGDIYVAEESGVDEFSYTGAYLARITGERTLTGDFKSVQSIAVGSVTHRVFVGDFRGEGSRVDVFNGNIIVPDTATGSVSRLKAESVTLNGTVDPDNEGVATCRFEWGASPALGQIAPCSASVSNGDNPVAVSADIGGLRPDTTYYYRLQATNANGTNFGETTENREFLTSGPGIHEAWASNVASGSATLDAKIDPNNASTTYYFQYGTDTGYGTSIPASPGIAIGSGKGDVEVGQHLQGLLTSTTYHYRVVAVSELAPDEFEAFDGPDQTFLTEAAVGVSGLPDGRAWEMVSPPSKHGATLEPSPEREGGVTQASVNGGAISYVANAPTEEEPQGNPAIERVQLFSSRGPDGWSTKVIATPHNAPTGTLVGKITEYLAFSPDLSLSVVEPKGDTPLSEETSERTPYLRHDSTCETNAATCYQPLVNAGNVPEAVKFGGNPEFKLGDVQFEGATPDLSHLVLESSVALTSAPGDEGIGLYEWTAGRLAKVSVFPGSEKGGPESISVLGDTTNKRHAISNDGSRIIWEGVSQTREDGLYMRDMSKQETVRLDVAEPGSQGGIGNPVFQTASNDGSRIFFTDTAQLTVGSSARSQPDLYEFDVDTGKLTDLTIDHNPEEDANVQGVVLGASEDGSYVYFVANGVLASGATPGDCEVLSMQPSDTCNLYVSHNGVTTFIAGLSGEDGEDHAGGTFASELANLAASVSPNGQWLAFMSDRSLTGYDNRDVNNGVRDEEVFLYDAVAKRVVCASCNPTGARPSGAFDIGNTPTPLFDQVSVWSERWLAAVIPSWNSFGNQRSMYQAHYLSNGGRLFFDSSDALVPRDTNGTWDVYEYEPEEQSLGDCTQADTTFSAASEGCVGLISPGGSAEESSFVDASENGDEAFFLTASQLVPQDYDQALDLYDARACTSSSPCLTAPPANSPPCSTGDSCKPAPSAQPESFGAPSSETFSGAGNLLALPPKAKVKTKTLTRAQKLVRALKTCRQKKIERKRVTCERQARKRYAKKAGHKATARKSLSGRTGR